LQILFFFLLLFYDVTHTYSDLYDPYCILCKASGYNVNSQRTSENGFDTHGKEAQAVKHRCMDVLGFDVYEESLTDGLQVLRYNKTTAYIPHLDWIDDYQKREEHDFDSGGRGSNRFATILLYMTDLEEGDGGETVFSEGWPSELAEEERVPFDKALAQLRESGDVEGVLKEGSWEESMVARCRSRLAVRPHSSRAVLFYSQNPDGSPDHNSLHGGCPVISGEKWAGELLYCCSYACFTFNNLQDAFTLISKSMGMECTPWGLPGSSHKQGSSRTQPSCQ
jgi:hypothetical protein